MSINFDPNGAAPNQSGIFGLPYNEQESNLILIPFPWEATTSCRGGCAKAPDALLKASKYIELFDPELGKFYEKGIFLRKPINKIITLNSKAKKLSKPIIECGGLFGPESKNKQLSICDKINKTSEEINNIVKNETESVISSGKIVGAIGGEHSIALGSIDAHVDAYPNLTVLQVDAHCDLRKSFENLQYSHGSVMWNVLNKTKLKKLVQVGIRSFCEAEFELCKSMQEKICIYGMSQITEEIATGGTWNNICNNIVNNLSNDVYVTFDIDGLDLAYCPNTGTPVPGGLSYNQILYLLQKIIKSNKKIIGFDLVEVTPKKNWITNYDWDSNVGAHLLYQLCGLCLQQKI